MKAFVDSREPDDVKLKMARGNLNGDITYDEKELPQGDFYLPEHDVVIERKEASDFASSTTDGRLSEQADRMVAEHEHVYVIIENDIQRDRYGEEEPVSLYNLKHSDINNNSITGMQTSLAVKRGIKIIYTESISDTCWAVNRIFERFADEEHRNAESGYVNTSDTGEVDDTQVAAIMQIRGISKKKAMDILDNVVKSENGEWVNYLFREHPDWLEDAIKDVDGVGEVLAQRVIDAFQ